MTPKVGTREMAFIVGGEVEVGVPAGAPIASESSRSATREVTGRQRQGFPLPARFRAARRGPRSHDRPHPRDRPHRHDRPYSPSVRAACLRSSALARREHIPPELSGATPARQSFRLLPGLASDGMAPLSSVRFSPRRGVGGGGVRFAAGDARTKAGGRGEVPVLQPRLGSQNQARSALGRAPLSVSTRVVRDFVSGRRLSDLERA